MAGDWKIDASAKVAGREAARATVFRCQRAVSMSLPSIDAAQSGFLAALTTAALWGLAGGFSHCIGMCGIFVLSCGPFDKANGQKSAGRRILIHLGRAASLVSVGAAAGALGSLAGLAAHTRCAQGLIAVVFGLVLALLALGYVGFIPWLRIPEPDILAAGGGAGRRLFVAQFYAGANLTNRFFWA